MTEAQIEFVLRELEEVNPDMIDALTFSVLAAVYTGETKLFGDLPMDKELDKWLSANNVGA